MLSNPNPDSQSQPPEPRTKLNSLSKYIFNIIHKKRQVTDSELMNELITQFGLVKEETLKRRKYDTVNILEMADIIRTEKYGGNSAIYVMKHAVPNSVRDVEEVKKEAEEIAERIEKKREILRTLRQTQRNYRNLIRINQLRQTSPEQSIALPIMAINRQFLQFSRQLKDSKQVVKMKFPTDATFISNPLDVDKIFDI